MEFNKAYNRDELVKFLRVNYSRRSIRQPSQAVSIHTSGNMYGTV